MKETYVASYGLGVDSTAMIIKLVKEKMPLDHVVFADTGGELPESYKYIPIMRKFLDKHNIQFTIVFPSKFRSLYERCFQRKVIPDKMMRWCTRDTKVLPIHRFYKKTIKTFIHEYMGIDAGEKKRVRIAKESFIEKHYPLIDWDMNRNDCIQYIKDQGFPVIEKSGCYFCPFNSISRWHKVMKKYPKLFKLAQKLEKNNKRYPKQTLGQVKLSLIHKMVPSGTDDYCGNGFA